MTEDKRTLRAVTKKDQELALTRQQIKSHKINANRERVIELAAQRLLRGWFPTKLPVDIKEWSTIANQDATWVIDELIEADLLKIETKETE